MEAAQIDMYMDHIAMDILPCIQNTMYPTRRGMPEWNEEAKMGIRKKLAEELFPRMFSRLEKAILANGNWLVGGHMTIADIYLAIQVKWIDSGVIDGFPKLYLCNLGMKSICDCKSKIESKLG